MKRIWLVAAAVLGAGVVLGLVWLSRAPTSGSVAPLPTVLPLQQGGPVAVASIEAEARLVPEQSVSLSFPVGGVVQQVLVAEGDQVEAGQLLAHLDTNRATALLAQADADVQRAQAQWQQIKAGASEQEVAQAEAAVRLAQAQQQLTQGSVTDADLVAAQAQLAQAQAQAAQVAAGPNQAEVQATQAQLAQAQAALVSQRDQLSADKTGAELRMEQAVQSLTAAQAALVTAEQNWRFVQETGQDPITPWLGTDPKTGKKIPNKLSEAQRQHYYAALVQAQAALRAAELGVQQAQVAAETARQAEVSGLQQAEQQVAQVQAQLDAVRARVGAAERAAARAAVAQSQATLDKLTGEQRQGAVAAAAAAVAQAERQLERLRAGASPNALAIANAELARAQAQAQLAQVALRETEVRAPFAGVITALDLQPGGYIAAGRPSITLANLSVWQLETSDLTERQIVAVAAQQPVLVRFDALPDVELPGHVVRVRAMGEVLQGDVTYRVTLALDHNDPRLRWNMTALVRFLAQPIQ